MRIRSFVRVLLAVLLVGVAACSALDAVDDEMTAPSHVSGSAGEAADAEPDVDRDVEREAAEDADGTAPGVAGGSGETLPPAQQTVGGAERIIKEGTVTIEVDEGGYLTAYERVVEAARRLGGAVSASTSRTDDLGRTSGSVTVRVPVEAYEDLLVGVGRVGDLRGQDIRSEDVTGQVVDLQARIRHLQAQEAFYLDLLDDAQDVSDAMRIQEQMGAIQQQIEQLRGRRDLLEDRAAYSTLTVELVEVGAEPVLTTGDGEPTLAAYWHLARAGFVRVVGWILVGGASLAPLLVPVGLAALAWRLTRRRPHTPATVAADVD